MSLEVESSIAQDLAGKAILFEIGANAGILEVLETSEYTTVSSLSHALSIPSDFLTDYLNTFSHLGLLSQHTLSDSTEIAFAKTPAYYREKNKAGYISWSMVSCAPLISNTRAFISDFNTAVRTYHRSGEHVARTSKWMGENDFYPHAEKVILGLNPKKVIDLGSGTCGLLMRLANALPNMRGVGVDLSTETCDIARSLIQEGQLSHRIDVIDSPIQHLIENPLVFTDADVVHAGFVFHDLIPDEEQTLNALLRTIRLASPNVTLVVVDAIPFSKHAHECAFSGAFSFLHRYFMGRKFPTDAEWKNKLNEAGFSQVTLQPLGISGGRVFIAHNSPSHIGE